MQEDYEKCRSNIEITQNKLEDMKYQLEVNDNQRMKNEESIEQWNQHISEQKDMLSELKINEIKLKQDYDKQNEKLRQSDIQRENITNDKHEIDEESKRIDKSIQENVSNLEERQRDLEKLESNRK